MADRNTLRGAPRWVHGFSWGLFGAFAFLLVSSLVSCGMCRSERTANSVPELVLPLKCQSLPLEIAGVNVTPHVFSKEIRYWLPASKKLGALVRIVVTNHDPERAISVRLRFNGRTPAELVASKDWSWYDMPENKNGDGKPYSLGAGKTDIFTFNGKRPPWSVGNSFTVTLSDEGRGVVEDQVIPIVPGSVEVTQASFLGGNDCRPYADSAVIHVTNHSDGPLRIRKVQLYTPNADGFVGSVATTSLDPFPADGAIPAKDRGGVTARFGDIPIVRGLVRVDLEGADGKTRTAWAPRFFGRQQFDIGSGWMDVPTEKGVVPLTKESFHKLLRRMHVNTARIESTAGYTDTMTEGGLYTRYPLRMMGFFSDVEKYNTDEWVMRIHGVDKVQEAQGDKTPMQVLESMKSYAASRYPVTMTFTEDRGFRHFAGITDFPHFDAYRVNAGSCDAWVLYKRWGWRRLAWGAPLEGIGEMTRTLNALSRPAPIAAWSQHTHEGWYGNSWRKRESPTPDEILIQAYEALANGAKGLYWYSIQSWSLLKDRDTIGVTTRIGREIRMLEDIYLSGDAYRHRRVGSARKPSLDLSSIVTPKHALLFAIDLEYKPNPKKEVFEFTGSRPVTASFELPGYLRNPKYLFRVDADGVHEAEWMTTRNGVEISGKLDRVGVYVATADGTYRETVRARHERLLEEERRTGFNPGEDDTDFAVLVRDLGYAGIEEVGKGK